MEANKTFEKRYIMIINMITVICIIAGSLIHVGSWIFGGLTGGIFGVKHGSGAGVEGGAEFAAEEISGVNVDLDLGEVKLESGDGYAVDYYGYPEGKEPRISQENGTLTVVQNIGGLNFNDARAGQDCGVTLTIPDGQKPTMSLILNMGSAECNEVELGDVTIDNNMGSVTINDCEMSGLTVTANTGEIVVKESEFTVGSFDADMGSITLKDVEFTSAECEANMGSIEVSGDFEKLTADCNIGSIRVDAEEDDAKVTLETDMGDVQFNGEDCGRSYSR